ncbi:hypothetical protein GCM10027076_05350 [Nocardioides montaniterrae]
MSRIKLQNIAVIAVGVGLVASWLVGGLWPTHHTVRDQSAPQDTPPAPAYVTPGTADALLPRHRPAGATPSESSPPRHGPRGRDGRTRARRASAGAAPRRAASGLGRQLAREQPFGRLDAAPDAAPLAEPVAQPQPVRPAHHPRERPQAAWVRLSAAAARPRWPSRSG